jgi:nucleoid-associated protein YgaU
MMLSGHLEHACLRVDDGDPLTRELRFMYNPAEFTTSKSATWARPAQRGAASTAQPEFQAANPQSVSMTIWFDAWDDPLADITGKIKTLFEWTKPTAPSIQNGAARPPVLRFEWGTSTVLMDFRGFLKQVDATYTLFEPNGKPIRAKCQLKLEEIPPEEPAQNPTSGSRESRKGRVIADGDSFASVAYREYGDPTLWRALAVFNGIDDPLRLDPGTQILVPSIAEARRLVARDD